MTAVAPGPGNLYDKTSATNPVERRLVAGFNAALVSLLPPEGGTVLDVGCGEGNHMATVARLRPGAVIAGVDLAEVAWLAHWHQHGRPVGVADAHDLPIADQSVDLVLALEILEHLDDPARAVAELARVCRSTAILSVPWEPVWRIGNLARGRYLTSLGNTPGHLQHFSRRRFLRMLDAHFEVDVVRRPLPWTFVRARSRRAA